MSQKSVILFLLIIGNISLIRAQQLRGFHAERYTLTPVFSYTQMSDANGESIKTIPRFSLSAMQKIHYGWKWFGVTGGLGVSNLGIITRPNETTILKRRVYSLTPEAGIRFGFPKAGLFMGIAGDIPIHYKEKEIAGGEKIRYTKFFSDKISRFIPSAYAGISFYYVEIRAQYLLGNFFNPKNPSFNGVSTKMLNIAFSFNHLYMQQFLRNIGGDYRKKPKSPPPPKWEGDDKNIQKTSL